LLQLFIILGCRLVVLSQAGQLHTGQPQILSSSVCQPELLACQRGDEVVGQVTPEPADQAVQRLPLLGLCRFVEGEDGCRKASLFIEQDLYWLLEKSVQEKMDFAFPISLFTWHGTRWRDKGNLFISLNGERKTPSG
jgi:hypothetical protein